MLISCKQGQLKTGYLSMQVSRNELQKVRVKLTREALTIQKEGSAYSSSLLESAANVSEMFIYFLCCCYFEIF